MEKDGNKKQTTSNLDQTKPHHKERKNDPNHTKQPTKTPSFGEVKLVSKETNLVSAPAVGLCQLLLRVCVNSCDGSVSTTVAGLCQLLWWVCVNYCGKSVSGLCQLLW